MKDLIYRYIMNAKLISLLLFSLLVLIFNHPCLYLKGGLSLNSFPLRITREPHSISGEISMEKAKKNFTKKKKANKWSSSGFKRHYK